MFDVHFHAGYIPATLNLGSLGGTVGDHRFDNIVLGTTDVGTDYNFGQLPVASTGSMSRASAIAAALPATHHDLHGATPSPGRSLLRALWTWVSLAKLRRP